MFWPGKKVLITAGPTREFLDPIRFLTNASSGKMGLALAREARKKGAKVVVILGPCAEPLPRGVAVTSIVTALQMHREVMKRRRGADVIIAAAAVGDWRFAAQAKHKIKKTSGRLKLTLISNPDILKEAGRVRRAGQILAGFALETKNRRSHALEKLKKKNIDLIVANGPDNLAAGLARITIYSRNFPSLKVGPVSKTAAAKVILSSIEKEAGLHER